MENNIQCCDNYVSYNQKDGKMNSTFLWFSSGDYYFIFIFCIIVCKCQWEEANNYCIKLYIILLHFTCKCTRKIKMFARSASQEHRFNANDHKTKYSSENGTITLN